MKNNKLLLLLLLGPLLVIGQELPLLRVKGKQQTKVPEKLETNEIAIVLEQYGGWSVYNYQTYYIFKNNNAVIGYRKQIPKPYLKEKKGLKETITKLELSSQQKKQLNDNLRASVTTDFLAFTQNDFSKDKNTKAHCIISDANGYAMHFIQNKKETSYRYYAPQEQLEKCNDPTINKVVLRKYVALIKMWDRQ